MQAQRPFLPLVRSQLPATPEPAALFPVMRGTAPMVEATRERNRGVNAEEYFAQLMIPVPGDFKHGTYSTFRDCGCRCLRCCHAFALGRDMGKVAHGTAAGYSNYGCRCDECMAAKNKYYREYYARRKEAEAVNLNRSGSLRSGY
jgi:hypothetical protein